MNSRYTKALAAFIAAGALAIPAVAQARGGDDPPNHAQRQHQVRHHGRHDRLDKHRRDRREDRDRRDGRGSDDGPNHR